MTFATIRPKLIAAVFMLAVATPSLPASAQIATSEFEMFTFRLEDSLRNRHQAAPRDMLAEIAVKTIDAFPVIFEVVAERAYEARAADPSIALDAGWTTPFLADIPPTILAFHGNRIAQSPLAALDSFHEAHVSYLEFLAERSEGLCASEVIGSLATVSPGRFRSATSADDEAVSQFSRLSSGVTVEAVRAVFAAVEAPQQSSLGEGELDALTTVLVAAGFTDEEVAELLEGRLPGDTETAKCEAGLRFQTALAELPDTARRGILAVYLTPSTPDRAGGQDEGGAALRR